LNNENSDFGDIDIAFELERRIEDTIEFEKENEKRIREAKQQGKIFSDIVEELWYPEKEVILKLRNKCQYISLHPMEDGILKMTKYKQIYPI
jgi:hypothetical protein